MRSATLAAIGTALLALGGCVTTDSNTPRATTGEDAPHASFIADGGPSIYRSSERGRDISTTVEGASGAAKDQKYLAFLNEERRKPNGKGLVLFAVDLSGMSGGWFGCSAGVGHIVDGKYQHVANLRATRIDSSGFSTGEPHALPPGAYVVSGVGCGRTAIGGRHATFTVRPGEFVDVGVLRLNADRNPPGGVPGQVLLKRSVGPTDAKHVTALTDQAPGLMSRRVQRSMVVTAAEDRIPMELPRIFSILPGGRSHETATPASAGLNDQ
jgi:hypothetical protein